VEVATRFGSREDLIPDLLSTDPSNWLEIMRRHGYEPDDGDEPVPAIVVATLEVVCRKTLQNVNAIPVKSYPKIP